MFKKFLAVLILYHHNCRILHWKVKDINFDEYHELASEYYDHLQEDLDKVTEIAITYNENPLSLIDAYNLLKDIKEDDYKIVEPNDDYSAKDVQDNLDIMFKDIMKIINELLKESKIQDNPGVRSELETMYSYYDKECNYKNMRRK